MPFAIRLPKRRLQHSRKECRNGAPPVFSPEDARIPDLDGLRGIAILLVIAIHSTSAILAFFSQGYPVTFVDRWAYLIQHVGWCGVDLFFVLSGFLITGILLKAKGEPGYYRNFYFRRALRIMPAYYALLFARLLLSNISYDWLAINSEEWIANAFHIGNLWQCHARTNDVRFDQGGLIVCWSLSIEEQFYLVWPLVVAAASRRWLGRICVAGIVVAVGCRWGLASLNVDHWMPYVLTPCRMDGLLIGALVALAAGSTPPATTSTRWPWIALLASGTAAAVVLALNHGPYHNGRAVLQFGFTCFGFAFAAMLWLVLAGQPAGWRWLRIRPLRAIGTRSYAIYLVHVPIIILVFRLLNRESIHEVLRPACELVGFSGPMFLSFFGLVILAALLVAELSRRFVEQPFLRLKRYFPTGRTEPERAAQ